MKKIGLLFIAVVLFSCNTKPVDYATLKGTLTNKNIQTLNIKSQGYSKVIKVDGEGSFSDTLKVVDGFYMLILGQQRGSIYLKNGYNLEIKFSEDIDSDSQITFVGEGSETNNFLEEKRSFFTSDFADPNSYFHLNKEKYDARVSEAKKLLNESKINISKVDTSVVSMIERNNKMLFEYLNSNYKKMHESATKLAVGAVSPAFIDYENYAGGTTSLKDLKGQFVYIDIWATWCGPCKAEIPNLKSLEKDFHGKNVEFVSISVDNIDGRRGSRESWLKMVEEKQLGGIQLFADNDFRSTFIQEYNIRSIPRFILIDPEGNIVDSNALRPSNPKIREYFKEKGI